MTKQSAVIALCKWVFSESEHCKKEHRLSLLKSTNFKISDYKDLVGIEEEESTLEKSKD